MENVPEINASLAALSQEARIAWLAGLFDADGTMLSGGREKQRAYISVEMTDFDTLAQCYHLFQGSLYGPYDKNTGHNAKPMYAWRVQKQADVWRLLDAMYPLLSIRRRNKIDLCRTRRDNFVSQGNRKWR